MIKAVSAKVNSPLVINCLASFSLSSESGIFLAADKMVLDACGACLHFLCIPLHSLVVC